MEIHFANQTIPFHPWRPQDGTVFEKAFAFDTETTLIDDSAPWHTPAYVLGAACDGSKGVYVRRKHASDFLEAHRGKPLVLHNAAFDLDVVDCLAPSLDVYEWVENDLVWDTQLLHQLYWIGKRGEPSRGKGRSTLATCAQHYLGEELPKDVVDSQGDPVRLSYAKYLNREPNEIESVYLEYLAKDVIATWMVYQKLLKMLGSLLEEQSSAFGYVDEDWLQEAQQRWGPQTHHIQVKAAVVLASITRRGLRVDPERREQLRQELEASRDRLGNELRSFGYLPGFKGSGKALQEILKRLERENPHLRFPRTDKGKYATRRDVLQDLANCEPFLNTLLQYRTVEKLCSTYIDKMGKSVLHPSFATLTNTGRTSSFGEINAQNLPRNDDIRSCFVPSPGHVFISADYSTVELATLAQSVQSQMGLPSKMAEAINDGKDLHRLIAARMTGNPLEQISKDERQRAKAVNFGKPGGMGNESLKNYAKTSYGIELNDEQVEDLSDAWFDEFPEMEKFLEDGNDIGLAVAEMFDLTPMTYYQHTDLRSFLDHANNAGRENEPHGILGWMCLKTLKEEKPCKQKGGEYSAGDIDFFWTQVATKLEELPKNHHAAVVARRASRELQRSVLRLADRAGVFTLTGRLRANAWYTARHNTVFQGLAADGAKLGLWLVWRAGYRIVNFIHDELLIEVPARRLRLHAEVIRRLMIQGMRMVVPDVRIEVEYKVTDRWYKDAEIVLDDWGRLRPYSKSGAAMAA